MGTFQKNILTLLHESSNYQGCLLTADKELSTYWGKEISVLLYYVRKTMVWLI